jgi:glycosyltransferase involved in cell wall biosynthesis
MVARFDPFKDHATFFSAARMLLRRVPNVVFVLAGKGLTPANPWVVAQLDGELRPRVRLLGEYSDPARLLTGLDIATLCSLTEGFPNSVGEAMSAELPCIATDVGDCRLLLGDASQLVPPRDPAAVAGAWLGLVLAGADVRRALGAAGRARIRENFSLGSAVDAYESLYTDLALRN